MPNISVDASDELVIDPDMMTVNRGNPVQWTPEGGTVFRVAFKGLSPLDKAVIANSTAYQVRADASPGRYEYRVTFVKNDKLYSDDSSPAIIVEL